MTIFGVWADQADALSPEQWVNVWWVSRTGHAEFYCTCQVQDLNLDCPSDYGLELIDGEGNSMPFQEVVGRIAG
ncbi:hypothetical protein BST81_02295 [Leptolyngbya sp. 'hensonii']|uniref:hypothetical protein n=1 Tax=Leptolyngbya sp. 'hensonii' TaxID=1922337 RepID=UPI00095034C6|nr:hypothetical protein [Leptolyngbya sp. 'hensonii']OLP20088.1 hypothetical protein BST81_02295 [Leptolyngbya sp. 'hensonii']